MDSDMVQQVNEMQNVLAKESSAMFEYDYKQGVYNDNF